MDPNLDNNIWASFSELKEQLTILAMSGIGGAFFRALLAPEVEWKRRVMQGLGGALSAIFLGGFMAQITDQFVETGYYSWLAWGFIMGSGGEVAVKFVQDKLMGGTNVGRNSK